MVDLLGEREKETQGVQHSGQSGMVRTELDRVVRDCAQSTREGEADSINTH